MTPYYEHGGITIYHGDCRDVMADLAPHFGDKPFDLLLTDPPYGIGADSHQGPASSGWTQYGLAGWDKERQPEGLAAALRACRHGIVWGGNYYSDMLPACQGWLVWDKGQREFSLADGELAWTSFDRALRITTIPRAHALADGKQHPTQKPEALMAWCLMCADRNAGKPIATILDAFMGSGTTLVACKRLGRQCVGIEREEKYCDIAAKRLQQEALPLEVA